LPATLGSEKLTTPMLLPAGESPFPAAPWHTAHFALYNEALLSSLFAATLIRKTQAKPAAALIPQLLDCVDAIVSATSVSRHHNTVAVRAWTV
jgi:hypothetical protein